MFFKRRYIQVQKFPAIVARFTIIEKVCSPKLKCSIYKYESFVGNSNWELITFFRLKIICAFCIDILKR